MGKYPDPPGSWVRGVEGSENMKRCPSCGLQYPDEEARCFVDGANLEEVDDPLIGVTLTGRYLIEAPLGAGGMATVYRARHTLVDRPVAVKVMSASLAQNESLKERFRREAKNAAALAHPNIIEIYDYGEGPEGAPFLVMELLEGAPLADFIAQGPMAPGQVAELGLQIAQGLARAHDFEVIHRDLKPENIFVSSQSSGRVQVKLLDFGIARSMHDSRLTSAGEVFGTPQYMAPERITSIDAGPSADLYALGVILFEMLTGKLPFEANQLTGFFIKHLQEAPPKPSEHVPQCPRRLEELILQLMAKAPEERPVDAHQVIKALANLVPSSSTAAPPPVTPARPIAAPTLPPTTLERWARRTAIFDEMLQVAFPAGDAPQELKEQLEAIRNTLRHLHELRGQGLKEQRRLETLENEARDNRARLGFAVQSLAEDLSLAREATRRAKADGQPYFEAEAAAQGTYRGAAARLEDAGGYRMLQQPDALLARSLREVAECIERWDLAQNAAEQAKRWVLAKEQEGADLEFQVKALRQQLERTEKEFDAKRRDFEEVLVHFGADAKRHEEQLIHLAGKYCEALRLRRELQPLFQRLEGH